MDLVECFMTIYEDKILHGRLIQKSKACGKGSIETQWIRCNVACP